MRDGERHDSDAQALCEFRMQPGLQVVQNPYGEGILWRRRGAPSVCRGRVEPDPFAAAK
jgi:hypothetical protein